MPDSETEIPEPKRVGVDLGTEVPPGPAIDTDKEREAIRMQLKAGLISADHALDEIDRLYMGLHSATPHDELAAALGAEARSDGFHAVVEVMGHRQYAGFVSEYTFGGHSFVRVDVPEVEVPDPEGGKRTLHAFSKMFGPGSIYALTPMSETAVRGMVIRFAKVPITKWDLPEEWQDLIGRGRLPGPDDVDGDEL